MKRLIGIDEAPEAAAGPAAGAQLAGTESPPTGAALPRPAEMAPPPLPKACPSVGRLAAALAPSLAALAAGAIAFPSD